jgi:hypothetical protein
VVPVLPPLADEGDRVEQPLAVRAPVATNAPAPSHVHRMPFEPPTDPRRTRPAALSDASGTLSEQAGLGKYDERLHA